VPLSNDSRPQADPNFRERRDEDDRDRDGSLGDGNDDRGDRWRERGSRKRFDSNSRDDDLDDLLDRNRLDSEDDGGGFPGRNENPPDFDDMDDDSSDNQIPDLNDEERRNFRPPMEEPVDDGSGTDSTLGPGSTESDSTEGDIVVPPPEPEEAPRARLGRGLLQAEDSRSGHSEALPFRRLARGKQLHSKRSRKSWAGHERKPRRRWIGVPASDGRVRL